MELKKIARLLYLGKERRHGRGQVWMMIYSDLMTNLMLFFLLLYALTRLDATEKELLQSSVRSSVTGENVTDVYIEEESDKIVEEMRVVEDMADLEVNEKRIKITLKAPVLFKSGRYELSLEAKRILSQIANILRDIPNEILIEGHTDNVSLLNGTNWQLSIKRAASVVYYFVKEEGLLRDKFIVAGYGEHKPLAVNDTPENRARNRRIEINVIKYE
jgi:chemotaxis protein MotB